MQKTGELLGHTERILHLAISPDGSTVVSIAKEYAFLKKKDCLKMDF